MLCLSRKVGESIRIGGNVVVTVSQVSGDRVRLAIQAPSNVAIVRPDAKNKEPKGRTT